MHDDLFLTFSALPENVALVRRAVGERAESYGLPEAAIGDLKTVVSEACANVVLHAYANAEEPGPLEVEMIREVAGLSVVVRDQGAGIGSRLKSTHTSLKMGLLLIGAISRSFQLRSSRDRGTELRVDLALPLSN